MLDSFEPGTRSVVKSLCQGRKRCVALMMMSEAGPRQPELEVGASPELELAFSHQVAWVLASTSQSGHIITLSCSGRSHTWLSRDDGKMSVDSVVMIIDQTIFKDWIMLILTRQCLMCATSRPPVPT